MASTYSQVTKQVGDLWVDALKRAEDAVTTSSRTQPSAFRPMSAPRSQTLGQLPTLREVVEANFELAERVLHAQKKYMLKAVEAAFPAPKTSAHPKKPAARKRPTRTAPRKAASV
jgi:hypothetical protein